MKFEERAPKLRELRRIYGGITEISKADVEREHGEAIPEIITGKLSIEEIEREHATKWAEWWYDTTDTVEKPEEPEELVRLSLMKSRELAWLNRGDSAAEWFKRLERNGRERDVRIAREAGLHLESETRAKRSHPTMSVLPPG